MKYHAQFLLDKEVGKSDAKLRYRVKWNGNIVAFSVGFRVDIEKWSVETQRCRANTTHGKKKVPANIINRQIQKYETACDYIFTKYEGLKRVPTVEEFRADFNSEIGRKKEEADLNFWTAFDSFISDQGYSSQWTKLTRGVMFRVKKILYDFRPDLDFEDVGESLLGDLQDYFINVLGYRNSTIKKKFSYVKAFFRWCQKKGYIDNSFEDFKLKLVHSQKKIIFLTTEELNKIREYNIPESKKHLQKVKDLFLFQCFTGLRWSDLINLKKSSIKNGSIEITTKKTSDRLIIELNRYSKEILENYEGENGDRLFPRISNQKMNDYLKELAELAGINEMVEITYFIGKKRFDEEYPKYALISTHCGRRTFICNALSLGIPPSVVMKWTGHSDYSAMKPYIDIADKVKINEMERFNSLL